MIETTLNKKDSLIKEGYKRTKLGLIPIDWEIKTLGEIGIFSKGKNINIKPTGNQKSIITHPKAFDFPLRWYIIIESKNE